MRFPHLPIKDIQRAALDGSRRALVTQDIYSTRLMSAQVFKVSDSPPRTISCAVCQPSMDHRRRHLICLMFRTSPAALITLWWKRAGPASDNRGSWERFSFRALLTFAGAENYELYKTVLRGQRDNPFVLYNYSEARTFLQSVKFSPAG